MTNGAAGILRPGAAAVPASFVSAVKDAARLSTFGHARGDGVAPAGASVSLFVRAGNSEKPDATWSAWVPTGPGGAANLPAARFFQWKADLAPSAKGESPSVERVEITYTERNARPVLENLAVLEPGARLRARACRGPERPLRHEPGRERDLRGPRAAARDRRPRGARPPPLAEGIPHADMEGAGPERRRVAI